jgi:hypothetical protein
VAAAHAEAWNAGSVEAGRFAELASRVEELAEGRPIGKQVQIWLREVGLQGARDTANRYEDAGADTFVFVLDEERDPDLVGRLGDAVR